MNYLFTKDVTIASSGTQSTALTLDGAFTLVGFIMPAAFTGTSLTVQQSMDERDASNSSWTPTNWYNAYDDGGNAVTFTVSTSRFINVSQNVLLASRHLRFVSGSTEGAARTITCVFRAVG